MQVTPDVIAAIYIIVPVLFGTGGGYVIGGQVNLGASERVLYGGIVSVIGGIMVGLIISAFLTPDPYSLLLAVISFAGGTALGFGFNWAPISKKGPQRHVVFDPDEDDKEFDRQIDEAFKPYDE